MVIYSGRKVMVVVVVIYVCREVTKSMVVCSGREVVESDAYR